jgi:hypothetical protein
MDTAEFAIEVISRGSFVDRNTNPEVTYLMHTATIRLNHEAMVAFQATFWHDERDCFADGEEGDKQYKARREEVAVAKEYFEQNVRVALGIGKGSIVQINSEVFGVFWGEKV